MFFIFNWYSDGFNEQERENNLKKKNQIWDGAKYSHVAF